MGNVHLVTGYAGQEHIKATDQAAFNAALIGTGQFVLDKGNVFEAQVISNNQIRVLDGELMMQGRFVRLDPDTYVDLTIENGVQGFYRNDLIVARYTKNTVSGVEEVNLAVIKGTAVSSNPADPSHTEGDITNGEALQHDFPLWRIPLNGLNVGSPVALFGEPFMDSMRTLPDVRALVNQIHGEVDSKLDDFEDHIDDKLAAAEEYVGEVVAMANVKVATGSYVGTGTYGKSNQNSLTFDFVPRMIFISSNTATVSGGVNVKWLIIDTNAKYLASEVYDIMENSTGVTLSGKTVSWYAGNAQAQANLKAVYNYFAIGV
jgi:hypothetical protein